MSYVRRHLMSGEVVVGETHLSRVVYLPALILFALAVLLFAVVYRGGADTRDALPLPIAFLAGAVVMTLWALLRQNSAEFAVTNKRVIVKVGFLRRHSTEILLRQVEGITVDQGILGRLLNYGTITIEGTGSDRTPYRGIAAPMRYRMAVQEEIEKATAPQATARAAGAPGDGYDTLLRLNELREKGALTEEEFAREKRKILG